MLRYLCEENGLTGADVSWILGVIEQLRLPDLVNEELVAALSKKSSFEFSQLFDVVNERLKERNAASGGEEMLRLRAYEKLQNLVSRGMVKKTGKKYKGLATLVPRRCPHQKPFYQQRKEKLMPTVSGLCR